MSELIRLNRLLSLKGICSRREADKWIQMGWVKVNSKVVHSLGQKVPEDAKLEISKEARQERASLATVIINKPLGYVSTRAEKNYKPAFDLITSERQDPSNRNQQALTPEDLEGLAVVGRLDINSKGLLLLTQDGVLAKKIIGPKSELEKEYLVRVRGTLSKENLNKLRHGLTIDHHKLKRAKVDWINEDQLQFVLTEGKKRQIRKMCEMVNLEILSLKRVRIGPVRLSGLKEGNWRFLSSEEVAQIKND